MPHVSREAFPSIALNPRAAWLQSERPLATSYLIPHSEFEMGYALYVLAVMLPPVPVQLVWKNWPRGLSTRS